jgi:ABC-type multidrug transport system fused ATPase/permease subunit
VLGIFILLLAVEPVGALVVVALLGLAAWGFQRFTHHRIARWGAARQLHDGLRIQHLQQGLAGAKDVILTGREDAFLAEYEVHSRGTARAGQLQQTLQQLPRLVLELLAVCGLAGLVFVMIQRRQSIDGLLPTLGLFAAAAFRLMPSANRVIGAFQNVRYALPSISVMYDEVRLAPAERPPSQGKPVQFTRQLVLESVSFRYAAAAAPALADVSLTVDAGSTVGFIGGSGAGKSTLVDVILGLLQPQSGTLRVDGREVRDDLRGWQNLIGYVPQSIFLTDDTLRRNVAFGLPDSQIDDQAVRRAIVAAQLGPYVDALPEGLDTAVGERGVRLSGGQLQRVGIARALYHDPQILVMDEATSSLDTETERGVMEAVYALHGRKTVLIVAHRLSTVENCDYLYRLDNGRISAQGTPMQVLAQSRAEPVRGG